MTGEAEAPQDAAGQLNAVDAQLLDALQGMWRGTYTIAHDAERGWWASRDGVVGHLLTAATIGELAHAILADYQPEWR